MSRYVSMNSKKREEKEETMMKKLTSVAVCFGDSTDNGMFCWQLCELGCGAGVSVGGATCIYISAG